MARTPRQRRAKTQRRTEALRTDPIFRAIFGGLTYPISQEIPGDWVYFAEKCAARATFAVRQTLAQIGHPVPEVNLNHRQRKVVIRKKGGG